MAKSRAPISPAWYAMRPASTARRKAFRHADRIAGLGDGGVEQHGVVAEFERVGGVRRRAQPGVDHQRDLGQPRAQELERVAIDDAARAADLRGPGHDHAAAGVAQPLRHRQILGAIGEYLEAVLDQDRRRLDQAHHIGLQGLVVADDLKLDPGRIEQLTRELRGGHRLAHAAAAGGVGQHGHAQVADERPEGIADAAARGFPPQRYRHDLRAAARIACCMMAGEG